MICLTALPNDRTDDSCEQYNDVYCVLMQSRNDDVSGTCDRSHGHTLTGGGTSGLWGKGFVWISRVSLRFSQPLPCPPPRHPVYLVDPRTRHTHSPRLAHPFTSAPPRIVAAGNRVINRLVRRAMSAQTIHRPGVVVYGDSRLVNLILASYVRVSVGT